VLRAAGAFEFGASVFGAQGAGEAEGEGVGAAGHFLMYVLSCTDIRYKGCWLLVEMCFEDEFGIF